MEQGIYDMAEKPSLLYIIYLQIYVRKGIKKISRMNDKIKK